MKENPVLTLSLIEDRQCTKCPEGQWSESRSTNCTKPIFDSLTWDTPEALEITLAVVLVVLINVSVGVLMLKHRGTFLVKASGGVMCYVALLSLIGSCLSLLLFLGKPADLLCRLQLPTIAIFQTVTLSIITAISLQVRVKSSSASVYFRVQFVSMLFTLSFHTDILLVRVPSTGIFSPEFSQMPWELVVCVYLLCGAGWYVRLVFSSRTLSD